MIRKLKKCIVCGLDKYIFSKKMCLTCFSLTRKSTIKTYKKINKKSTNYKKREEEYNKIKDDLLKNTSKCEMPGCTNTELEIHHKSGRIGDNLFKNLMVICRKCHIFIHENPSLSLKNGWLIKKYL